MSSIAKSATSWSACKTIGKTTAAKLTKTCSSISKIVRKTCCRTPSICQKSIDTTQASWWIRTSTTRVYALLTCASICIAISKREKAIWRAWCRTLTYIKTSTETSCAGVWRCTCFALRLAGLTSQGSIILIICLGTRRLATSIQEIIERTTQTYRCSCTSVTRRNTLGAGSTICIKSSRAAVQALRIVEKKWGVTTGTSGCWINAC